MRWLALLSLMFPALVAAQEPAQSEIRPTGVRFWSEHFELNTEVLAQFRLTVQDERGNGPNGTDGRDFANFRVPRCKLSFFGHFFNEQFQYRLQLNFARDPSRLVEVARLSYAAGTFLNFNAGQDRVPWDWERRVPGQNLRFAERTYANEVFNQGWGKGVWLNGAFGGEAPLVKYWFGLFNGVMAADNDFRNEDGALTADAFSRFIDAQAMVSGRVETQPLGAMPTGFGDMRDTDEHGSLRVAAGGGICWFSSDFADGQLRGDTTILPTGSGRTRTNQETWAFTADAHARWFGISIDAAVYWRITEFHNRGSNRFTPRNKVGISDLADWGFSIEAGYFILPGELGVFARFDGVDADEFWGSDGFFSTDGRQRAIRPDTLEAGVGVNYYLRGERLKFSLDVNYVSQQLAFAYDGGNTLLGVYNTPPARRGFPGSAPPNADYNVLWIVRLQIQWIL